MKRFKFLAVFALVAALAFAAGTRTFAQAPSGQDEIMTNDEVISLVKAGLSGAVIVNKIRTSKSNFDLSTDALIKLKQAGVSDEIVTAMLEAKSGKTTATTTTSTVAGNPNDPSSPHDFGIYLFENKNEVKKMTQLTPNVSAQNRTGGLWTSSMTYGLGKVKTKANLPGTAANLQLQESQPVFYFYLDTKSGGLNTSSGIPSTTNEFALVKFNVRSDNREVTISKSNSYSAKGGLSDESVVPFTTENLGNGVFKVTPKAPLKNGEYGFYLINSGGSNTSAAIGAKFFDFGVKLVP